MPPVVARAAAWLALRRSASSSARLPATPRPAAGSSSRLLADGAPAITTVAAAGERAAAAAAPPLRHPKRKLALAVAYDGSFFYGSQMQRDVPTVDRALMDALAGAGLLGDPSNEGDPSKVGWTRASRTDRGVHALGNVVSVKVRAPVEDYLRNGHAPHVVDAVNDRLPHHVRVLSAVRVTGGFNAYQDAVSRVYHYFLPAEALARGGSGSGIPGGGAAADAAASVTGDDIADFNAVLSSLVGQHHFHNFTASHVRRAKVRPGDVAAWRRLESEVAAVVAATAPPPDAAGAAAAASSSSSLDEAAGDEGVDDDGSAAGGSGDALERALRLPPANVRMEFTGAHGGYVHDDGSGQYARPSLSGTAGGAASEARRYLALCRAVLQGAAGGGDAPAGGGRLSASLQQRLAAASMHRWTDYRSWVYDNDAGRAIYHFAAAPHAWPVLRLPDGSLRLGRSGDVGSAGSDGVDVLDWNAAAAAAEPPLPLTFAPLDGAASVAAASRRRRGANSAVAGVASPEQAAAAAGGEELGRLVCVTVHGSGFLLNQIRFMLGCALAVHHGVLPREYARAALILPEAPRLPLAPAGGLVQGEVHFAVNSFLTWAHPPGTPEDAAPVDGYNLREAHVDDPRHVAPLEAATRSADAALLTASAAGARRAFFTAHLLPRLAEFAGWVAPPAATAPDVVAAAAAADASRVSPLDETMPQWLERLRAGRHGPTPACARAAMEWHAAMAPSHEAYLARRSAAQAVQRRLHAERLWAREGAAPPTHLKAPVHLAAAPVPEATGGDGGAHPPTCPLRQASLAEVHHHLLPAGLATALAVATGITHQRELMDLLRAVAYRVAAAEWPFEATPEQHAGWVVATGARLLVREGKLLHPLDRAGVRQALKHARWADKGVPVVDGAGASAAAALLTQHGRGLGNKYGHATGVA
jgi:tRNA pseudouridine(38-40) synthase